ncbi:MAG: hypothetical protein IPN29_06960 [Saprospiraceae bacterium]|nr:hypothetical protein [Saprospiraceae bacterium]
MSEKPTAKPTSTLHSHCNGCGCFSCPEVHAGGFFKPIVVTANKGTFTIQSCAWDGLAEVRIA